MEEMDLPYRSLVGFSGTVHDQDTHQDYTESSMNGVPETQINQPNSPTLI
jgi:type I restriction enzyme R subunit